MLSVSELSKFSNVTADAVRHYVRIGLLHPARHPNNGYNQFKGEDVKKVEFIRQAKRLGFTLSDIKKILNSRHDGDSPCSLAREIINQRIVENNIKITELAALQKRMENALKNWSVMPDVDGICHLIESIESEEEIHYIKTNA